MWYRVVKILADVYSNKVAYDLNFFQSKVSSPTSGGNPFMSNSSSSVSTPSAATLDLFGAEPSIVPQHNLPHMQSKPSDDLLQLSNPFMDAFSVPQQQQPLTPNFPAVNNNAWAPNGNDWKIYR